MAQAEKKAVQEALSQATVEFTSSFVIPNPRNGVYAARLESGYLKITLPEKEKNGLLALLRSDPTSAQAWLDSATEAIRKEYEKSNSQKFTLPLPPLGGAPAQTRAPTDTSSIRSTRITKVEPPQSGKIAWAKGPEIRSGGDIDLQPENLAEAKEPAEKPAVEVSKPAIVSGTGTYTDPFVLKFPKAAGEDDAIGCVTVTFKPRMEFENATAIWFKVTLQQAHFAASRFAGTCKDAAQLVMQRVRTSLEGDGVPSEDARNFSIQARAKILDIFSVEKTKLESEGSKLAQYLSAN